MATGEIRNRDRFKQVVNFSALRYGEIAPTDIDGFLDFGNKLFVVIEFKLKDTEMGRGQCLAIERLVDNLQISGKEAVAIIAEHEFYDCNDDIDIYKCRVVKIRHNFDWHQPKPPMTQFGNPQEAINAYREKFL